MKRACFLATVTLLPLSLACSGGGATPGVTPTPVGAASAAASAKSTPSSGGAPSVTAVTFRPPQSNQYPNVTDVITANAATMDPDGEGVTVEWKWFHNGREIPGQLADTLRPAGWKKNDRIEAEATPRDVKGTVGSPLRSLIIVRNAMPALTSRPTGSLNGYKAIVQDADSTDPNERFTWALEAPVPGFSLSSDGTLKFDAVAGKAANGQRVTIMVTDSAGAVAKQTFDVKF